jgi:hypothetical protein
MLLLGVLVKAELPITRGMNYHTRRAKIHVNTRTVHGLSRVRVRVDLAGWPRDRS